MDKASAGVIDWQRLFAQKIALTYALGESDSTRAVWRATGDAGGVTVEWALTAVITQRTKNVFGFGDWKGAKT